MVRATTKKKHSAPTSPHRSIQNKPVCQKCNWTKLKFVEPGFASKQNKPIQSEWVRRSARRGCASCPVVKANGLISCTNSQWTTNEPKYGKPNWICPSCTICPLKRFEKNISSAANIFERRITKIANREIWIKRLTHVYCYPHRPRIAVITVQRIRQAETNKQHCQLVLISSIHWMKWKQTKAIRRFRRLRFYIITARNRLRQSDSAFYQFQNQVKETHDPHPPTTTKVYLSYRRQSKWNWRTILYCQINMCWHRMSSGRRTRNRIWQHTMMDRLLCWKWFPKVIF